MANYVRLLGLPAVERPDHRTEPPVAKTAAIAWYLACQQSWVQRGDLLLLLWPEAEDGKARRNLRQLLTKLRRLEYAPGLETEANRLRWNPRTDVADFRRAVAKSRWIEAVELYRGDFLEGFGIRDAPEFDAWLEMERHELRQSWRSAVTSLSAQLERTERFSEAADLLGRLRRSEPLDEEALRAYMTAAYFANDHPGALAAFDSFASLLQRELAESPHPDTIQLVDDIRGERLSRSGDHPMAPQTLPTVLGVRRLPVELTSFVGRKHDVEQVCLRLSGRDCRLLTLVGLGGMGKTRLALEVARRLGSDFRDGVAVASLEDALGQEHMITVLASALEFVPYGRQDPKLQLLDYLSTRTTLLVLDNLEHLGSEWPLLTKILSEAPGVKILATSRTRLALRSEWVYDLPGLEYPPIGSDPLGALDYDAARLYRQAADRAKSGQRPQQVDGEAVSRICRSLGGVPLALELAAGWTRVLDDGEIADELERGLLTLASDSNDIPGRQRNFQAVFDQSWSLLSYGESHALEKLIVFRGGFSKEAAEEVTGVGPPLLLSLANKSFLHRQANSRFLLHPLMTQYVRARVELQPKTQRSLEDCARRHSDYYLRLMVTRSSAFKSGRGEEVLNEIEIDFANIEAAWNFAVDHDIQLLSLEAVDALGWFHILRGRFHSGPPAFIRAASSVREGSTLHGRLLGYAGFLTGRSGDSSGIHLVERALETAERHGMTRDEAQWLRALGVLHSELEPPDAQARDAAYRRALERYRELADTEGIAMILNNLAFSSPSPSEAEELYRESVQLSRQGNEPHALGMTLMGLAQLRFFARGACREALEAAEEGVSCLEETGNLVALPASLALRGRILLTMGEHPAARREIANLEKLAEAVDRSAAGGTKALAISLRAREAFLTGDHAQSQELCAAARDLAGESNESKVLLEMSELQARLDLDRGEPSIAETRLQQLEEQIGAGSPTGDFERIHLQACASALRGRVNQDGDRFEQAQRRFLEGLVLASEHGCDPACLDVMSGLADLLLETDQAARSLPLLAIARTHPASFPESRERALLVTERWGLTDEAVESAHWGRTPELHSLAAETISFLRAAMGEAA